MRIEPGDFGPEWVTPATIEAWLFRKRAPAPPPERPSPERARATTRAGGRSPRWMIPEPPTGEHKVTASTAAAAQRAR